MYARKQTGDLQGKTVSVEVYLFIPNEDRPSWLPRSYAWGVNEKILSAGMMGTADAAIKDIIESYRKREPEYIALSFPTNIPRALDIKWLSQLRRGLLEVQIESFRIALENHTVIGIGSKKE